MTNFFEDLYDHAPCGYLSTTPDGVVTTVNETFLTWTKYLRDDLLGKTFTLLVAPDSYIFYETRYLPILQLGGDVREVALMVRCADGSTLPILINSTTRLTADGAPLLVRTAIFDATQRHDLERQLLSARRSVRGSGSSFAGRINRFRHLHNAAEPGRNTGLPIADCFSRDGRRSHAARRVGDPPRGSGNPRP
jgi:PAS domain S-box-containing protein